MVYCGIPSRACLGCRTRRTKCDYLKPSCSQCIRMGRICNGYRDPVAVLFRDESKGFATKRQRLTGPRKPHSAVARKSSLEIDAALAACSTMFISSPLSDPDQSCGTSLSEPMEDLLDECSSVKDKGTSFLETSFTIEHLNTGQGHKRFDPSNFAPEISNPDYGSSIGINPQLLDKAQSANQATLVCGLDSRTGLRSLIIHSSITSSLEIQAPCFFFSNYVLENTSYSKGFLDYLPGLCANEVANSFLMQAVTALGLVGLAMKTHDSNVLISARQDYASALNQLNVALTSKERALTDQALTTVFLLGLYEVSCTRPVLSVVLTPFVIDQYLLNSSESSCMDEAYQRSDSDVAASRKTPAGFPCGTPDFCSMAQSNCKLSNKPSWRYELTAPGRILSPQTNRNTRIRYRVVTRAFAA